MPGARRTRKGQTGKGKDAQIRKPSAGGAQFGGGPDNYDGRANTNAGTPADQPPKKTGEKAAVIKTY